MSFQTLYIKANSYLEIKAESSSASKMASPNTEMEYEAVPTFPDELLETIFCHFSGSTIGRAHAVCRKWNEILLELTKRSDMWFRRCKAEIPKYTLMQICNHPLESRYRSGIEWKDVFVRWQVFRGKRLFDGADLEPKKVISRGSEGIVIPQGYFTRLHTLCFTDDVVYEYIRGNILAYDVHSEASMRRKHSSATTFALDIQTLGMTVPVDAEGKTLFEANVEKAVVVILMEGHLEFLIGLETKFIVRLSYTAMTPLCTWYDTIMVQMDTPGSLEVQAFRVQLDDGGTRQLSVDHIQTCHPKCFGALHALLLTENKALMLRGTNLLMWDIAVGEEYRSLSLTSPTPEDSQKGVMSWVGSTIAVTDCSGPNSIILYYLDAECERLQNVRWIDPQEPVLAFSLLYDDNIIMSDINNQCYLLIFKREDESDGRKDILECSLVQQVKSYGIKDEQGSESGNDSSVSKTLQATRDTVDEANSYKKTLSVLLGIGEGDQLWENFDAEANSSGDCQHVDRCSESSDSDWSELDNEGSCSTHEEYILERWKNGSVDLELSKIAKASFMQKPILHEISVPFQGYRTFKWKYFFTDSSVAIDTAWDDMFQDRLFIYKWNFVQ